MSNQKRAFFKGVSNPFAFFIYPPYYEDKSKFAECLECEEKPCIKACEENILEEEKGFVVIKFGKNGCTFCDECANVCDKGVLNIEHKKSKLNCELLINPKTCMAWNQTVCFACNDVCDVRAINFRGMFNPIIDEEKCTNCGFCISVCPANSIEVLRESV